MEALARRDEEERKRLKLGALSISRSGAVRLGGLSRLVAGVGARSSARASQRPAILPRWASARAS